MAKAHNGKLEDALTSLIQAQATLSQTQPVFNQTQAAFNQSLQALATRMAETDRILPSALRASSRFFSITAAFLRRTRTSCKHFPRRYARSSAFGRPRAIRQESFAAIE